MRYIHVLEVWVDFNLYSTEVFERSIVSRFLSFKGRHHMVVFCKFETTTVIYSACHTLNMNCHVFFFTAANNRWIAIFQEIFLERDVCREACLLTLVPSPLLTQSFSQMVIAFSSPPTRCIVLISTSQFAWGLLVD